MVSAGCSKQEEQPAGEQQAAVEETPAKPEVGAMVLVPAGEFIMGNDKDKFASPQHKETLPAYYIDVYEVTFGQWIEFTTKSGFNEESDWRSFYTVGKENFPVANITLDDAQAYAKWAGKRLPTEAEWEKAGRGTEGFLYPWGNTWDPTKSNCGEYGMRNTVEVGQMKLDKSPYGVYDMMGNVQEWTSDELKPYKGNKDAGDETFRRGYRVVRGASFVMYPSKGGGMFLYTRSGYFAKAQYGLGFRCVKDAEAPKTTSNPEPKLLALLFPKFTQLEAR
jgi:formylglycine-generating enzyme required for sulfatase activity